MKTIKKAFCETCGYETPLAEVICLDVLNNDSWTELRCKPCFDYSIPWEERWG
jgi:hypothetical protein